MDASSTGEKTYSIALDSFLLNADPANCPLYSCTNVVDAVDSSTCGTSVSSYVGAAKDNTNVNIVVDTTSSHALAYYCLSCKI